MKGLTKTDLGVVVLGVVVFASSFLEWFWVRVSGQAVPGGSQRGSIQVWDLIGNDGRVAKLGVVLAGLAVAWVVGRTSETRTGRLSAAQVTALLVVAGTVLLAARVLTLDLLRDTGVLAERGLTVTSGKGVGFFVGLAASFAQSLVAVAGVVAERRAPAEAAGSAAGGEATGDAGPTGEAGADLPPAGGDDWPTPPADDWPTPPTDDDWPAPPPAGDDRPRSG